MSFPKPPFKLNDEDKGDRVLLDYLKQDTSVTFVSEETRDLLKEISTDEKLTKARDHLLKKVWPAVLKDGYITESARQFVRIQLHAR